MDDRRIWVIAEALRRGFSYDMIHEITKIDIWFIDKLAILVEMEAALKAAGKDLTPELLKEAKRIEFPDNVIARLTGLSQDEVKAMRYENNIRAAFKMVDTCAAEFEAKTPYYYSTYGSEDEVQPQGNKSVVVFGSGPIRIGQGIEFDYCSVHASWALRKAGHKAIVINNNPETVSTDFDTSDALYFEPLTVDDVMEVIEKEKPEGLSVSLAVRQLSIWLLLWPREEYALSDLPMKVSIWRKTENVLIRSWDSWALPDLRLSGGK